MLSVVVLYQAHVALHALGHSGQYAWQVCRLIIDGGQDEAAAHLRRLLRVWAAMIVASLGHHLRVLVELIKGEAGIVLVIWIRCYAAEGLVHNF